MFMTPDAWREELHPARRRRARRPRSAPGERGDPPGRGQARRRRDPAGAAAAPAVGALRRGQVPVPLRPARHVHRHRGVRTAARATASRSPTSSSPWGARSGSRSRPHSCQARAGERKGRRPHHRQQPRGRGAARTGRTGSTTTSTAGPTSGRWAFNPSTTSGSPRSTSTTAAPTSCVPAHPDIAAALLRLRGHELAPEVRPGLGKRRRRTAAPGDVGGAFDAYSQALDDRCRTTPRSSETSRRCTGRSAGSTRPRLALEGGRPRERHAPRAGRARATSSSRRARATGASSCTSGHAPLAPQPRRPLGRPCPRRDRARPTAERARQDLERALALEPTTSTRRSLLRELTSQRASPGHAEGACAGRW